tara:strand:+ start:114 stop:314 length:201 start_codon:yes stop_codon:yes gene_type:complete
VSGFHLIGTGLLRCKIGGIALIRGGEGTLAVVVRLVIDDVGLLGIESDWTEELRLLGVVVVLLTGL